MSGDVWRFVIHMQIEVINQVLGRTFISKMAFNPVHNILAVVLDSADTLSFFLLEKESQQLIEVFQKSSKPSGKRTSLSWSPDGVYLALGAARLQIWKLDGGRIAPFRTFNQQFSDIKMIAWSDSSTIAYGGISAKNTLNIRQIQSENYKQIPLILAPSSISFDPFGKYLLVLLRNNILYVYSSNNYSKIKQVNLSFPIKPTQNVYTVKETRVMGWSPDFTHVIVPSLDDGKISAALGLERQSYFLPKKAFLGHISSISCASFSPNMYIYQQDVVSIAALGDSHGVVSLWMVGKNNYQKPLIIINSEANYSQVVEQIEWNKQGDVLMVNYLKRYMSIMKINKQIFGKQLSPDQKSNIIQNSFGVTSVNNLKSKQVQTFSSSNLKQQVIKQFIQKSTLNSTTQNQNTAIEQENNKAQIVQVQPNSTPQAIATEQKKKQIIIQQKFQIFSNQNSQLIKINEQVTIKQKGGKKKIQPSLLVKKQQAQKIKLNYPLVNTIKQYQPLKLKQISFQGKAFKLYDRGYLEIKKIQNQTLVQIFSHQNKYQRFFIGSIQFIKHIRTRIYILSSHTLYILNQDLSMSQLPHCIGDIHRIQINSVGDIYYLSTKGYIKGFNHIQNKCHTPSPIPIHTLFQTASFKPQNNASPLQQFSVEDEGNLYICLTNKPQKYMYNNKLGCWSTLQFTSSNIKTGHSVRITIQQQQLSKIFLQSLVVKTNPTGQNERQLHNCIQNIQNNIVYYKKHKPNKEMYHQNILNLIKQLKNKNINDKLRSTIIKYFTNNQSQEYIDDHRLRNQVKCIGGFVIEEFILFGKL